MTTSVQADPTLMTLLERARAESAERQAKYAAEQEKERQENEQSDIRSLTSAMQRKLGLLVDPAAVNVRSGYPVTYIEGVVFGYRKANDWYYAGDRAELVIARPCTKGCGVEVWTGVESLAEVADVLDKQYAHQWDCTDEASKRPPTPPVIPFDREQRAIDDVLAAAEVYAQAVRSVMELEDLRPLLKAKAIGEMLGTPNPLGKPGALHSASSAEAVVEQHGDYWQHRQKQAQAEVERIRAHAALDVAKMRARLAINAIRAGDDDA
jgi:hypothetical protein